MSRVHRAGRRRRSAVTRFLAAVFIAMLVLAAIPPIVFGDDTEPPLVGPDYRTVSFVIVDETSPVVAGRPYTATIAVDGNGAPVPPGIGMAWPEWPADRNGAVSVGAAESIGLVGKFHAVGPDGTFTIGWTVPADLFSVDVLSPTMGVVLNYFTFGPGEFAYLQPTYTGHLRYERHVWREQ